MTSSGSSTRTGSGSCWTRSAGTRGRGPLSRQRWTRWRVNRAALSGLTIDPREVLRRLEILEHEAEEIAGARLRPGEADEITRQLAAAQHARDDHLGGGRGPRDAARRGRRGAGAGGPGRARPPGHSPASTTGGEPWRTVSRASRRRSRTSRPRSAPWRTPWTTTRRRSRASRTGSARSTGCCAGTATTRRRSSPTGSGRPRRSPGCGAWRRSGLAAPRRTPGCCSRWRTRRPPCRSSGHGTAARLGHAVSAVLAELGFPEDAFAVGDGAPARGPGRPRGRGGR